MKLRRDCAYKEMVLLQNVWNALRPFQTKNALCSPSACIWLGFLEARFRQAQV